MPKQGIFKPKHPEKYRGDPKRIVYRSWLEFKVMRRLDERDDVVWWASEEQAIPYYNPVKKRPARYFPDVICAFRQPDGSEQVWMVEIKPAKECVPPKWGKRRNRRKFIAEGYTYEQNQAKWAAAEAFCRKRGWRWTVLTDKQIDAMR